MLNITAMMDDRSPDTRARFAQQWAWSPGGAIRGKVSGFRRRFR
jgi:hypothetical protein